MRCHRVNLRLIFGLAGLILLIWPFSDARAESSAVRLSGRILLQVQSQGEAWYINPLDWRRYYLGRPADAFALMRRFGLGISEQNYKKFAQTGAANLKGRILLRTETSGEAYYVNPEDNRLYYLGRPADAFALMRRFGLGINNQDLNKIIVGGNVVAVAVDDTVARSYDWRYQDKIYYLSAKLSTNLYQIYNHSPKVYTYYAGQEPIDIRDAFYGLFLRLNSADNETNGLLAALEKKAAASGLTSEETAAFALAFIQYLPYDYEKVAAGNNNPYYPFETLYLQKGVCADKSFLAVLWLRRLGYGAAILDFPDSNHSAAGIACPAADSLAGSGYCYVETTNYFPVGIVPPSITNGQASSTVENLDNLFSAARLGRMEIKQASAGKIYQGVAAVKAEVADLQKEQQRLKQNKIELDAKQASLDSVYQSLKTQERSLSAYKANGEIDAYNRLVPAYNEAVAAYQIQAAAYEQTANAYNLAIQAFNQHYRLFYQE